MHKCVYQDKEIEKEDMFHKKMDLKHSQTWCYIVDILRDKLEKQT